MDELIHFDGVSKVYPMGETEVRALNDVNLDVDRGELLVILGPSGSGKTTLLNLIGGMDTITHGKLMVNGADVSGLDSKELTDYRAKTIGFVFQFFNLVPTLTAGENVELGLISPGKEGKGKAKESLEQVGLGERVSHFPSQLSGGEQQRVAIARAICKKPPILLCDEPTGELDFKTGLTILELMQRINRENKQTIIMVTHNTAISEMADRVVHLHSGEVSEVVKNDTPREASELRW